MIIDFHTHLFPEEISQRALNKLTEGIIKVQGSDILTPKSDATLAGLKESMKNAGVDISVVMPIATNIKQSAAINSFAKEITCDNIISFASLHPYQEDWEWVLEDIAKKDIPGIKLHPEFQSFYVDEPVICDIVKKAKENGLLVTLHSGMDLGFEPPVHCTPERMCRLLDKTEGDNIICAHLGGFMLWEEVLNLLAGSSVYMDISMTSGYIENDLFTEIIKRHGAEKILFGSDSPWQSPVSSLEILEKSDLTDEEKEMIKYKNAARLLKIGM